MRSIIDMLTRKRPEIEQHRPAYFSEFESDTVKFDSLDELMDIPFVKNFRTSPDGTPDGSFHQYSITDSENLMAEYDGGDKWFVVGYLRNIGDVLSGLPKWQYKRPAPKQGEGS